MTTFTDKLKELYSDIEEKVISLAYKNNSVCPYTGTAGMKVIRDRDYHFCVEGRKISHITGHCLVADGLTYSYTCLPIEELVDLVDKLCTKFEK